MGAAAQWSIQGEAKAVAQCRLLGGDAVCPWSEIDLRGGWGSQGVVDRRDAKQARQFMTVARDRCVQGRRQARHDALSPSWLGATQQTGARHATRYGINKNCPSIHICQGGLTRSNPPEMQNCLSTPASVAVIGLSNRRPRRPSRPRPRPQRQSTPSARIDAPTPPVLHQDPPGG